MVKCPICNLLLFTTTKEFEISIEGVYVGRAPVTSGHCTRCGVDHIFLSLKVAKGRLNITSQGDSYGKAQ